MFFVLKGLGGSERRIKATRISRIRAASTDEFDGSNAKSAVDIGPWVGSSVPTIDLVTTLNALKNPKGKSVVSFVEFTSPGGRPVYVNKNAVSEISEPVAALHHTNAKAVLHVGSDFQQVKETVTDAEKLLI